MGFQTCKLYREIELDVDIATAASGTLTVYTNFPGNVMALRHTATIAATSGRAPINVRLPGTCIGKLIRLKLSCTGIVRLYGSRVLAKEIGTPDAEPPAWGWFPVYVEQTPEEFAVVHLPITPTPEEWTVVHLPITQTPEDWTVMKLAMRDTPDVFAWVDIPMDAK